jgi:molybdopterin-guanine dinucleotide biosynthesis protein A
MEMGNGMANGGAIVLAGGRSERMGQDKALLRTNNGTTLLETVVATLRALVGEIVVVADRADRYALPDCRMLGDAYPQTGPLGGIVTGLRALGAGHHLAVACDMPALQPAALRLLLDSAGPEWDVVVPEIEGRMEPLCAVYSDTAIPALQAYLESGGRALHRALAEVRTRRIPETALRHVDPALRTFTNLNTPDDLERLQRSEANRL